MIFFSEVVNCDCEEKNQKDAMKTLEQDQEKKAPYLALLQVTSGKMGKSSCMTLARFSF